MPEQYVIILIVFYFVILLGISYITSKGADIQSFFIGNRKSYWVVVAFGMISASLSGVTFISVPGWVRDSNFFYLQLVFGYLPGYLVIAHVLMPVYYKLRLTSIYTYLNQRFGIFTYKTGASFFLISRIIGAAFRLFLVATVLQIALFDSLGVHFTYTVAGTILLIYVYTFKGGIKTIIWTDALQTLFLLTSAFLTFYFLSREMHSGIAETFEQIRLSSYSQVFNWDYKSEYFFVKQFLSGMFIAIVMTGLDQDMMQKNLSCRNLKEAQKNIYAYSCAFVPVNILFMGLGVLLILFIQSNGLLMPESSDEIFPLVALQSGLPVIVGVFFLIGLIAAAYSSADSALTALTTSFTVDILNAPEKYPHKITRIKNFVHIAVAIIFFLVIILFNAYNDRSVISAIFKMAGYTYGPLLGLYALGLFSKIQVKDRWVPLIAVISPLLCIALNHYSPILFGGYRFGFEILLVNGFFMIIGLLVIRNRM